MTAVIYFILGVAVAPEGRFLMPNYPFWLAHVEDELNALGDIIEMNAEEPWQAEVHKNVVGAWAMLRDHRQATRDEGGAS